MFDGNQITAAVLCVGVYVVALAVWCGFFALFTDLDPKTFREEFFPISATVFAVLILLPGVIGILTSLK